MTVPLVRAGGDPFAFGAAHGRALGPRLRAFLADDLARLNRVLQRPVTLPGLRPLITAYDRAITAATPALAAEVTGLAEGAGIPREQAVLLQIRREVMGYRRTPTMGDCTTYARTAAEPVLAQTVDLNGDLDDQVAVLNRDGHCLVLSFAGLLGYLGLNRHGLAIGLNLVLGGTWQPGVPPYLAIRHLLDHATGVEHALTLLAGLPLASSRSLTLCDPGTTATVEVRDNRHHVHRGPVSVHTNHFRHPDALADDALNPFARRFSVRRLETCTTRLAALPPDAPAEAHLDLLSTPPVHVRDDGDPRRERTVATVALFPARGELHLRPGDPSRNPTEVFRLA